MSSVNAAALRLQQALREFLELKSKSFPESRTKAQGLLGSLEAEGVSDRRVPRGRRLKRVTDKEVTKIRKNRNHLRKKVGKLETRVRDLQAPGKRNRHITSLWCGACGCKGGG